MAVNPSPAAARVARLLNTLAEAPEGELPLAELVRRTGIRKPTAHSLLLGLAEEGFVARCGPRPSYRLGPALVSLASAAGHDVTLAEAVEPELARLGEQLQVSTMAGRPEGDEIVVLAARCLPHPFGFEVAAGTRVPLRPPIGGIYVAWSDEAAVRAWCERSEPPVADEQRAALGRDLAAIRRRGWSATIRRPAAGRVVLREATDDDLAGSGLTVVGVAAPVWGRGRRPACSLAAIGLAGPLDGEAVRALAADLVAAAARATSRLTRAPDAVVGH